METIFNINTGQNVTDIKTYIHYSQMIIHSYQKEADMGCMYWISYNIIATIS